MPHHRTRSVALALSWSLLSLACGDPAQPGGSPGVQFAEHSAVIAVGDTLRLTLLPMLPPGYVAPVSWSSSDAATASVERVGTLAAVVRGLRVGQAVITATGEGASDSVAVTVAGAGA